MTITWSLRIGWANPLMPTEESSRLVSFSIEDGRDNELDDYATGKMTIVLDNYDGRYSPWNTSSPLYPNVRPGKVVLLLAKYDSTTHATFLGNLQDVEIVGSKDDQRTVLTVYDLGYPRYCSIADIPLQTDELRIDELLVFPLVSSVTVVYGESHDRVVYFHSKNQNKLDLTRDLVRSDLGILISRSSLDYIPRQYNASLAPIDPRGEFTLDESDIHDLALNTPWSNVINHITINCQPYQKQAETTLWELWDQTVYVAPGQSVVLWAQFTDDAGNLIPADDIVTPVATTDYTAHTAQGGSGTNMTASMSVTADNYGVKSKLTVSNTHPTAAFYITSLKIRGCPIETTSASVTVEDATSIAAYGTRHLTRDCPYIQSVSQATDYANTLLYWYKDPTKEVTVRATSLFPDVLQWRPEDFVTFTSATYNIDERMRIIQRKLSATGSGLDVQAEIKMVSTSGRQYWILEDATWGVLGSTTILGY